MSQPHAATLVRPRTKLMLFAPLAILLAAALVTNFGGGVARDAKAADIAISASVTSTKTISACAGGTFATLATAGLQTAPDCLVTFGATNDIGTATISYQTGSSKLLGASGVGASHFTEAGATFGALGSNQTGVKLSDTTAAGGDGTAAGGFTKSANNSNTDFRGIPAKGSAVNFCSASSIGQKTCYLTFGANVSGTVPADTYGSTVEVLVA